MIDKKIIPPDDMIEAALNALAKKWATDMDDSVKRIHRWNIECVLIAALTWLSENPIVPSSEMVQKIYGQMRIPGDRDSIRYGASQFQRYIFLAPEPVKPKELDDLYAEEQPYVLTINRSQYNVDLIEAFRRGQKAGK